jgi:hypothetical protein
MPELIGEQAARTDYYEMLHEAFIAGLVRT